MSSHASRRGRRAPPSAGTTAVGITIPSPTALPPVPSEVDVCRAARVMAPLKFEAALRYVHEQPAEGSAASTESGKPKRQIAPHAGPPPAAAKVPTCSVCFEAFSESCIPGLMICGHGLCSVCWSKLRIHPFGRRCPTCRVGAQHCFTPNRPLADMLGFTIVVPRSPADVLRSMLDQREHDVSVEQTRALAQFFKILRMIHSLLKEHGATIAHNERVIVQDRFVTAPRIMLYQISNLIYSKTGVVVVFQELDSHRANGVWQKRKAEAEAANRPFRRVQTKLFEIHLMYAECVSTSVRKVYERYLKISGISRPGSAFDEFHCAPPADRSVIGLVVAQAFKEKHDGHWFRAAVRTESGDIKLSSHTAPKRLRPHEPVAVASPSATKRPRVAPETVEQPKQTKEDNTARGGDDGDAK